MSRQDQYLKKFLHVITLQKYLLQRKISKHTTCGYSLFTHCSFDNSKNKNDFRRGADCMEEFCADLKKHATEIIYYEKKEMIP